MTLTPLNVGRPMRDSIKRKRKTKEKKKKIVRASLSLPYQHASVHQQELITSLPT
jgi:hypothetical protein